MQAILQLHRQKCISTEAETLNGFRAAENQMELNPLTAAVGCGSSVMGSELFRQASSKVSAVYSRGIYSV